MSAEARAPRRMRLWSGLMLATAAMATGARAQAPGGADIPAAPVFLNHPAVVDTAHLKGGDTAVTLFGVLGWGGDPARGLQSLIADNGDRVTCRPRSGGSYVCTLPTGLDVAATALASGAAQTTADSPADYHEQEAAAQAARLGIWSGLPPAPVAVRHPAVQTTADLAADGRIFTLAGLIGFNAQYYTLQMQNYIATHGDRLSCQQQDGGRYVCVLPDGADIAAVALLAGLARVGSDASQEYQADQAKAAAAKAGFWFDPPQQVLTQLTPAQPAPDCCVPAPGDLGGGIAYDNGIPTAIIDGEPVFFAFAGLAGWGFYDHYHRWHAAPERFRAHLDRFHPEGSGLRSQVRGGGQAAAFRLPGSPGLEGSRGPQVFNGGNGALPREARLQAIHPLGIGSGFAGIRPGFNPGALQFRRPVAVPSLVSRPNFPAVAGLRPGVASVPRIVAPVPGFLGRR